MSKLYFQKLITALLVAVLFMSSFTTLAKAENLNAPAAQVVRANQVKGTISGGKFAKIWLGLETETPGAQITVTNDWDRDNPLQNGVGFFILDDTGLTRAQAGEALNTIALAAGNASFTVNSASNSLGASLNAVGTAKYTVVIYNDSNTDANFTLTASNAFIVDDSQQVTNPNAAPAATAVVTGTVAAGTTTATTTTVATAVATPAATVATTTTTAVAVATTAPAAVGTPGVVKAQELSGDLPNQNDQHFLGLQPNERDATITLRLTFDPQDSTELARRLNFWVLDPAGFTQFQGGSNASDVAIAAGSRDVDSQDNERVAHFKAVGTGSYTVIVYNNSRVPGSYTLTAAGGLLVDDSNQTRNAKQVTPAVAATGATTVTKTTTTTATTATPAAQTSTTATTTTTTAARTGTPGGTYTVKSGDTIALIARDIYGDYKLYQQLCAFNNITACDAIEVGQTIKLPTQAQIKAGITTTTAAPAATPTKAATTATTTVAKPTATLTTTTTAGTTTTKPLTTTTATTTGAVTTTTPATTTTATTTTAGAGGSTIVDTAIANGGLKTLVAALEATGADSILKGPGPFTLFAPTDAAFAALPRGSLQQLMANPTGQLTDIVHYHIIKGKLLAADLSDGLEATTLQGKAVKFSVSGNTIKINGYRVLTKDIQASNGVIHVIETVILPPAD